ncbi:hypothetical protein [Amycolatopsis sp. NBC_00438]|uniref:hypothetical protein n=1 Tax=Amycolatopsis sp. NBC_00438 TaxID=2903558 RepID=UPI002E1C73E6
MTAATVTRSLGEFDVIATVAGMSSAQHQEWRNSCGHAADLYRVTLPTVAAFWDALATIGGTAGALEASLTRCTVDDVRHIEAVLLGAELSVRRSPRIRAVWAVCRDLVAEVVAERGRRPLVAARGTHDLSTPLAAVEQDYHQGRRTEAVLTALAESGSAGVPTRDLTARFGGSAVRTALQRLRNAGRVELRDGLNYLVSGLET